MSGAWTFVRRTVAAMLAALAVAGSVPAEAVDLRSWDQQIKEPNKRFVVLSAFNDEAVLDKETQLVWQAAPNPSPYTGWHTAFQGCLARQTGGRRGWRLPTAHELTSLIAPGFASGAPNLPAGHPFTVSSTGPYATSTVSPINASVVLTVSLSHGSNSADAASDPVYAWCVRGPGI